MKGANKTFSGFKSVPKKKNSSNKLIGSSIDEKQQRQLTSHNGFRSAIRNPVIQPENILKSALVYDNSQAQSQENYLYHKNIQEKRQIASLTKIMTCLITLMYIQEEDIKPEAQYFYVSRQAADLKGTTASFQEGDKASIWDLLFGLMLPSGNDAALCLAQGIGRKISNGEWKRPKLLIEGQKKYTQKTPVFKEAKKKPADYFIGQMNKMAQKLRMKDTHYSNPHGLPDEMNFSTAKDQLILIRICLERPYFCKIVKTKLYFGMVEQTNKSNWTRQMLWENTNRLLYRGYEGIKTGNTIPAGHCLASWYKSGKFDLILIVLGTNSKDERDSQTIRLTKLGISTLEKDKKQLVDD